REAAGDELLDSIAVARTRAQEWMAAMAIRKHMLSHEDLARGYFEVRYEELVRRPQEVLEPLFAFLGESFDPEVLAFHDVPRNVAGSEEWSAAAVRRPLYESSCGRWRHSLGTGELAAVMDVAGRELEALGYGG
ncbi:MAG TPA: hypothetical protein VHG33_11925, partial [Woeseiaceae bacterium]|nr:hypothetical protein [Woeseiaceae bacterium]